MKRWRLRTRLGRHRRRAGHARRPAGVRSPRTRAAARADRVAARVCAGAAFGLIARAALPSAWMPTSSLVRQMNQSRLRAADLLHRHPMSPYLGMSCRGRVSPPSGAARPSSPTARSPPGLRPHCGKLGDPDCHSLGHTRSAATRRPPAADAGHVRAGAVARACVNAMAIVHVSPAIGAAFTQYTAELEPTATCPPRSRAALRLRAVGRGT